MRYSVEATRARASGKTQRGAYAAAFATPRVHNAVVRVGRRVTNVRIVEAAQQGCMLARPRVRQNALQAGSAIGVHAMKWESVRAVPVKWRVSQCVRAEAVVREESDIVGKLVQPGWQRTYGVPTIRTHGSVADSGDTLSASVRTTCPLAGGCLKRRPTIRTVYWYGRPLARDANPSPPATRLIYQCIYAVNVRERHAAGSTVAPGMHRERATTRLKNIYIHGCSQVTIIPGMYTQR